MDPGVAMSPSESHLSPPAPYTPFKTIMAFSQETSQKARMDFLSRKQCPKPPNLPRPPPPPPITPTRRRSGPVTAGAPMASRRTPSPSGARGTSDTAARARAVILLPNKEQRQRHALMFLLSGGFVPQWHAATAGQWSARGESALPQR